MFKIRKFILITLVFLVFIIFSGFQKNSQIKQSSVSATVIEVLDTDSIKVSLDGTGDIAYVKLKGINGKGYDEGYEYLTNIAMGEKVTIITDFQSNFDQKWNIANVFLNGVNLSEDLLSKGYAILDKTQNRGANYNKLLESENIAYSYNLGIWKENSSNYSSITGVSKPSYYTKDRININTASLSQLKNLLKDVPKDVCENIIYYRERNPFNNIKEIKFVKGFNNQMFDKNKNIITISTNIITANEYELSTLGFSNEQINKLIELRNKDEIKNIKDINNTVISPSLFNKIKYFISTSDIQDIQYRISSSIANINGSSLEYLQKIGLSYQEASEILGNRHNGYTYKTFQELTKFTDTYISEDDINYFEDNLNIKTNINTSNEEELIYLFGYSDGKKLYKKNIKKLEDLKKYVSNSTYEKYKECIYIDSFEPSYININTASKTTLSNIGFSNNQIDKIFKSRPILNSSKLPFDIKFIDDKISLYTNINLATRDELVSLGLDNVMINSIISYRQNQFFSSKDELKALFEANNYMQIYKKIEKFIVFR